MNDIEKEKSADVAIQVKAAAKRALKEAEDRKHVAEAESASANSAPTPAKEINGRGGLDPVRYGDWEKKGIAVDF